MLGHPSWLPSSLSTGGTSLFQRQDSWHPLFFGGEQDEGPCSFQRADIQDTKKGKNSSQEPGTKMGGTRKRTS